MNTYLEKQREKRDFINLMKENIIHIRFMNIYIIDVISAVDNFFNPWDPSSATLMEKVCKPRVGGQIPSEYLGQSMKFSADPTILQYWS